MVAAKRRAMKVALSLSRIEALTDGVFAIVMTLLVLELSVPIITGASVHAELTRQVFEMWPKFLSYVVTFLMLGFMWSVHNHQFSHIKRLDSVLGWINIIFLMFVALLPFSTSMLGEYMGEQLSVLLYGGNFIACMIVRYILWSYATEKHRLVDTYIDPNEVRMPKVMLPMGIIFFAIAMGISYLNTVVAVCIFAATIIFFITRTTLYYRIHATD